MIIKAIAVDDEPPALQVIAHFCEKMPFVSLQATFTQPEEAMDYVVKNQPDLIFLDIMMPNLKGTDFARIIQPFGAKIIFTSAYTEYAIEGFELQVLDYLVKPISLGRFVSAANRAYQEFISRRGGTASIFVKDSYDWVRIDLADILYLKSDSNLLFFHLKNGTPISTRMTINEMLELLPKESFIRIHKSYIAATAAIKKIERHQVTIGKETVPVGHSYRDLVASVLLGNGKL